ncbi:MAG: hypothetical protein ACKOTB_13435 [Planctomycetia bacterium]
MRGLVAAAATGGIARRWPTALAVAYTLAAFSWTMTPDLFPFKRLIDPVAAVPFMALGLWQTWDMFSPEPRSEDICVELAFTDRDGTRERRMLTDMVAMGYAERWQKDRWRKYFNDHLRLDAQRLLWQPFAEYAVRRLRDEGRDPVSVDLVRRWRECEPIVHPWLRAGVRPTRWSQYAFHRWQVPAGWE